MSLHNYFSLKRFSLLLKQDLLINKTKYLLTILGLGLVTYLLSYWFFSESKSQIMNYELGVYNRYMICFVFYMVAVGIIVGTAFPDLTDKIKTANYLLAPGSTFEKFMVQFLIRIGLFVPIALGIFWIAIRLAKASLIPEMLYENTFFNPDLVPYFEFHFLVSNGDKLWDTWQVLFMIFGFFSYGAYLFAGTTFFKRFALVKTVVFSAILFMSSILFAMLLSHIMYPVETHGFDMHFDTFPVTEKLDSAKMFCLYLSMPTWIFFLTFAYFKLKEREV